MDSPIEVYPGGLPKGNVQYKNADIVERSVNPIVSEALQQIGGFNFTITDATSTKEEDKALGRKSTTHLEGRAIDVRYDDQGHELVRWITQTPDGNNWADKYGVSILPHGEGSNIHYHIQFSPTATTKKYEDYEKHTKELLENKGYSKAAIAGIMGNIAVETGGSFDYTQKQKGGNGYGLFQFDFMKSHYYNYLEKNKIRDSADAQIAFMDDVINGRVAMMSESQRKKLKEVIDTSEDPEEIARVFMEIFENPGVPHLDRRTRQAKDYYGKYFTS